MCQKEYYGHDFRDSIGFDEIDITVSLVLYTMECEEHTHIYTVCTRKRRMQGKVRKIWMNLKIVPDGVQNSVAGSTLIQYIQQTNQ